MGTTVIKTTGTPYGMIGNDGTMGVVPNRFMQIEVDVKSFASGKFRAAYHGKVFTNKKVQLYAPHLACWRIKPGYDYYPCVVKMFKREHAMLADMWVPDAKMLHEARALAMDFNAYKEQLVIDGHALAECHRLELQFASAFVYEVDKPGSVIPFKWNMFRKREDASAKEYEKVLVEPLLNGEYVKLNSNSGWCNWLPDNSHEVGQAFSHWTWHQTSGAVLLCDLQGVLNAKTWTLTDPAAHSMKENHHGVTDLGKRGINKFFLEHSCNDLCRNLKKYQTFPDPYFKACRPTTLSMELPHFSTEVHKQVGGTCYAHACATVVRAAEARIVGRSPLPHNALVQEIVDVHGSNGGNAGRVLEELCPPRHLRCRHISSEEAVQALMIGRAVLGAFYISEEQWSEFAIFFQDNPDGVLNSLNQTGDDKLEGHAVAVVNHIEGVWRIKNSWGVSFANRGFFMVALGAIDFQFWDVFFLEEDLTDLDRTNYAKHMQSFHSIDIEGGK